MRASRPLGRESPACGCPRTENEAQAQRWATLPSWEVAETPRPEGILSVDFSGKPLTLAAHEGQPMQAVTQLLGFRDMLELQLVAKDVEAPIAKALGQ